MKNDQWLDVIEINMNCTVVMKEIDIALSKRGNMRDYEAVLRLQKDAREMFKILDKGRGK